MSTASYMNASVGPYVLRERISAGGVAEVFRAIHRDDRRDSAVKLMRVEKQAEKHHAKAFRDEFNLLQELDHPAIPKARRFDEIKGRLCFVMDLVPGTPLHQVLADRLPCDGQRVFLQLVEVVAYLHEQGVVHNDLKLENVILRPDGNIGLVDFGNARRQARRKGLLARLLGRKEPVFGTPTYLAPELIAGEGAPTFRSDLYSLGVCCFVLLSGEPPFTYDRKSARLRAAVNQTAPSIRSRVPSLPGTFAKLIDSCLAKDPALRLEDATQLHQGLKLILKANAKAVGSIEV